MKARMKTTVELADVALWLRRARRVTALTGAGISTDSGIPDFPVGGARGVARVRQP